MPLVTFVISVGHILTFLNLFTYADYGAGGPLVTIFYAIQAVLFNGKMYNTLPDAIRYVNPDWSYVEEGQPLFPFFFYRFGIVSRETANADQEIDSSNTQPIDDDEIVILTL